MTQNNGSGDSVLQKVEEKRVSLCVFKLSSFFLFKFYVFEEGKNLEIYLDTKFETNYKSHRHKSQSSCIKLVIYLNKFLAKKYIM